MKTMRNQRRRQSGFSLLEVLVAFAILSVSLGVLMQIFSQAMRTTLVSSQYSRAASLAESKLNAVGTAIPLEEGSVSGDPEGGIAWEITILPVTLGEEFGAEPPATPYRINATALWEDGSQVRSLTLSTLRLGERF
ncbi:general secretion pathway protein I [Thiocapsa rosea]|uniref:General secretion pathway protein I n=2 Tax=Thiocapsa rosea TaxID=69360 RepID=A0A495V3U8_9GAMM|nr:general secretion pathway protein I [Thiocapsa rosea]